MDNLTDQNKIGRYVTPEGCVITLIPGPVIPTARSVFDIQQKIRLFQKANGLSGMRKLRDRLCVQPNLLCAWLKRGALPIEERFWPKIINAGIATEQELRQASINYAIWKKSIRRAPKKNQRVRSKGSSSVVTALNRIKRARARVAEILATGRALTRKEVDLLRTVEGGSIMERT